MISLTEYPEFKSVELRVDGEITNEEFDAIATQLESFIEEHGTIKILEVIENFPSFSPDVLWKGIKFDVKNLKHFSHAAVVSDLEWLGPISSALNKMLQMEIRCFPSSEAEKAREWVKSS